MLIKNSAVKFCFSIVLFTVAPAAFASAQSLDGFIESFRAAQVSAPMVRDSDNELPALGRMRTDGDYSHGAGGDGLSVLDEYRGYVFDGGPNGLTNCHKRLSFSRKELLVEVSEQENMSNDVGSGGIVNPEAFNAYSLTNIMGQVANFYCHSTQGMGIDLYWCRDALHMPEIEYAYTNGVVRTNAYRYVGEMIHRGVTNICLIAGGYIYIDRILQKQSRDKHDLIYGVRSEYEPYFRLNRNPLLKLFVKVILTSRKPQIIKGIENIPYFVDLQHIGLANAYFYARHTDILNQGAIIQLVDLSEENYFEANGENYTAASFLDVVSFSLAHEVSHLIGLRHENAGTISLLGSKRPIVDITVTCDELLQVNLKERASVSK